MRIVTWNTRHGGGKRAVQFAETLAEFEPDAVVLTEFRNNQPSRQIIKTLENRGIGFFSSCNTSPRINSVVIGAKEPFEYTQLAELGSEAHRCVSANIRGINVLGLYFPQRHEKVRVFEALCSLDSAICNSDSILIGDFNTGRHFLDELSKTFIAPQYFDRLENLGWIDAWRSRNRNVREYSWYSNSGNGFRIDHAFVSESLNQKISEIYYEHRVRESGLSDHSALVVDIDNSSH